MALKQIIDIECQTLDGLLTSIASEGRARMQTIIRNDGQSLDLAFVRKSTVSGRLWDYVDLDTTVAADGLRVSIGKADEDAWFYCDSFTPVGLTAVLLETFQEGGTTANDIQQLTLGAGAYGGSYQLTVALPNVVTGDGATPVTRSFTISATATASEIATILNSHPEAVLTSLRGITVTGAVGGTFTISFILHLGNQDITEIVESDIDVLLPKRYTGRLEQQPALADSFTASGSTSLTGLYEIEIEAPGEEPFTPLQVPVKVIKDIITGSTTGNAVAGAFKFLPLVTGLTGGGSTKLDGVVTVGKTFNVVSFVESTLGLVSYQLVTGTDAEASPGIIRPDDYNGATNARVWKSI